MIGEAMPRFDKLTKAFKADPQFLQVMGHFYQDLLEFHRRAYKFFRRRGKNLIQSEIRVIQLYLLASSVEDCVRILVEDLQFAFPRDTGKSKKAQRSY